jgi:plasmid maintenance system antidote protein VapI
VESDAASVQGGAPRTVDLLREAIWNSGQSLNQLSEVNGVPRQQSSRFVRGERTLTLPVAEKVCRALHLTLAREKQEEE